MNNWSRLLLLGFSWLIVIDLAQAYEETPGDSRDNGGEQQRSAGGEEPISADAETLEIPGQEEGLFSLSLDELMDVRVETAGTLTRTEPRYVPAAVTTITQEMIQHSGARSLNEVLDIFVPNVQIMRGHSFCRRVGIRGIVEVPENKYLLLVNGEVMNLRQSEGAETERDLPMLGDIHHVDVVRGPGSVVYGPGAISGVISIVTYDGLTMEGTDVTLRQGLVEQFSSFEVRHGHKIDGESGLFVFYGTTNYPGANQDDAPYVFSRSFSTARLGYVPAGNPADFEISDDGRAFRSHFKHKLHLQFSRGEFDAWIRFTRGGGEYNRPLRSLATPPLGLGSGLDEGTGSGRGYQQLSAQVSGTHELSGTMSIDLRMGFKLTETEQFFPKPIFSFQRSSRESALGGRILAHWNPNDSHILSFGMEYAHEWFGRDAKWFSVSTPTHTRLQSDVTPWSTNTYSPLMEYQWRISEQWRLFAGARADKHTYSNWLISPRAALVYTPTEKDTLKLIAGQSVRRPEDDELRVMTQRTGKFSDEENIQSLELRYERWHSEHLWFGLSAFYMDNELTTVDQISLRSVQLGEFSSFGCEAELSYHTDNLRLQLSHGFAKLSSFDLNRPDMAQGVSASPYGYGNNLANWSNHVTKLYGRYQLNDKWSVDGSLRVYWGFPGAEDLTELNNDLLLRTGSPRLLYPLSDPGHDEAFDASVFLNLGLEHRPTDQLTIRLDAYNILGWIDKDLNKRNFHVRTSEYRSEAAAVGVTVRYSF